MDEDIKKITVLTEQDIGKWVVYKPELENEIGKIKSFNNERQIAFVVYKANNNWDGDHWKDYTASSTSYNDLAFTKAQQFIESLEKEDVSSL